MQFVRKGTKQFANDNLDKQMRISAFLHVFTTVTVFGIFRYFLVVMFFKRWFGDTEGGSQCHPLVFRLLFDVNICFYKFVENISGIFSAHQKLQC